MLENRRGVLNTHSRSLDLAARGFDVLLIWVGLMAAHNQMDTSWTFKSNVLSMLSLVFFQIFAEISGLYLSWRSQSLSVAFRKLFYVLCLTFSVLVIAAWASREPHWISRRTLFMWWFIYGGVLLIAWRVLLRTLLLRLRQHGFNTRRVAVVGSGTLAKSLLQKIHLNPWMGLVVHGVYTNEDFQSPDFPYQGDCMRVIEAARNGDVDNVYITLPMSQEEYIRELVDGLMDTTASIFLIPDLFAFNLMNARHDNICGLPAISLVDSPLSVFGGVLKCAFDQVLSIAILMLIAVPMLCIAAAVKITSKGPVIFKQQRYGIDGKPISVWKFRSMTTMDDGADVKQATKNDARLTPIGGFLRRTSLDELPQFINVLQGRMSIVGPRPHAVSHNEIYRKQIKGYMMRHKMKPGITGWAQVNGYRGETDTLEKMEKRIEYDLEYIRNWSVWLDVKIIWMTLLGGFSGKNAY
jgi:putative colanic acid biosynthesis UDP-glucose lipid carrier transferase